MKTAELNNTAPEIVWCAQLPALVLMVIKECWDAKTVYGTEWEEGVVRWWSSRPVLPESADPACESSRPPVWAGPHKTKTSLPHLRGGKVFFVYRKDSASGLGEYLGHDLPAVRALLLGVEVHINGACRRKVPEPVQGVQIPALIFVSANRGWGLSMLLQGAVLSPGLLYNESRNRRR